MLASKMKERVQIFIHILFLLLCEGCGGGVGVHLIYYVIIFISIAKRTVEKRA